MIQIKKVFILEFFFAMTFTYPSTSLYGAGLVEKRLDNQKQSSSKIPNNQTPTEGRGVISKPIENKIADRSSGIKIIPRPKIGSNQMAIFKDGRYFLIRTKKVNGLEVSENCFQANKIPNCAAINTAEVKISILKSSSGVASNPASMLCEQVLGRNYIAIDSKGKEFDYCGFSDGSFVDTWTLFERVMKK